MKFEGFDTETHPIGPGAIAPHPVVLSRSRNGGELALPGTEEWDEAVADVLDPEGDTVALWQNAKFDLAVLANYDPDLIPYIFDALESGRIQCVILREKLLNLARFGSIENLPLPGGGNKRMSYDLVSLEKDYLGLDRSDDKGEDAWRSNYRELEGMPLEEWPEKAVTYAIDDAVNLVMIAEGQEQRRQQLIQERDIDPWGCHGGEAVLRHRCTLDFALYLITMEGMCTNPAKIAEVQEKLKRDLAPEKISLLVENDIVIPAKPEMPFKNGAKDHVPDCPRKGDCDCPVKIKKAQKEKLNKGVLQAYVADMCERLDIPLYMTDPTEKFPEGQIQVNADWLKQYAHLDPVTEQYQHRQSLQKLVTTELPRMMWEGEPAERVHANFDCLKETGRTSSYGGKLYPSFNGQNVYSIIRDCFQAPDGWALLSVDYSAMELGTAAQTMLNHIGFSVLGDKINAGFCAHAYLGAHLAFHLSDEFHEVALAEGVSAGDDLYHVFRALEKDDSEEIRKFYKHWRTFAKPTGLGYPGGLGPATFIEYARATYNVDLIKTYGSLAEAERIAENLREIWLNTFPEFREYLKKYLNRQAVDVWNSSVDKDGNKDTRYCYTTPMGLHRAGATFCAAANGMALQSPSAEGATRAVIRLVRAAYDETVESPLYLRHLPCNFVHDESLGHVSLDDDLDEIANEVCRVMVESMREITPDVKAGAEPAYMIQWSKAADPVYDDQGRIQVWRPKE